MSNEPTLEKGRGRQAKKPAKIPLKGWKDILLRIKDKLGNDHLSIIAAGVGFYSLLAVFPGLAALVSLYGLVSDPMEVQDQLAIANRFIPPDSFRIIADQLQAIARQSESNLGFGFVGGLLFTLWSANKGVKTLMVALNIVYNETEDRGFLKKNLLSLLYTLLTVLFFVVILILLVIAPVILALVPLPLSTQQIITYLQWPFMAVMVMLLLNFTYCFFPNRKRAKWRWVTYGSVFATVFWMLASAAFSYYVNNFGNYNKMYGSVGAMIVLMMWFYLTAFILLLGGELNAEVEHQTARDSTVGEPKPMGKRGAFVADHLGEKK